MKQFSLKVLLLIVAVVGGVCAWWTYDPFGDAVRAIQNHGGGVSYYDRSVGISFAAWMASMPEIPEVVTHYPLAEMPEDLSGIYDDIRYLAHQRPALRVVFSNEEQARAMHEHFERFPVEGHHVLFGSRWAHSYYLVIQEDEP